MPVPRQPQRSEALEERNHGFLIFSTLLPTHAPRKASKMKPYFKWSPEALRRERIHIPPAAACITSREKEENSYLNRGGHFSCRSLSCWGGEGGRRPPPAPTATRKWRFAASEKPPRPRTPAVLRRIPVQNHPPWFPHRTRKSWPSSRSFR